MTFSNFGKSLKDHSEEELFVLINNSSPQFASMAQVELIRRLSE